MTAVGRDRLGASRRMVAIERAAMIEASSAWAAAEWRRVCWGRVHTCSARVSGGSALPKPRGVGSWRIMGSSEEDGAHPVASGSKRVHTSLNAFRSTRET